MKALTVPQPYASLTALGVRTIETRSWPCPPSLIGQPLAIHAGQREPGPRRPGVAMRLGAWATWWAHVAVPPGWTLQPVPQCGGGLFPLPLGAVVATCRVAACVPMVERLADPPCDHLTIGGDGRIRLWQFTPNGERRLWTAYDPAKRPSAGGPGVDDRSDQLPYGDFSPGRYAWLLENVKPTTERCPVCWRIPSRAVDQRTGMRYVDDGYGNPFPCTWCDGRGHGCPPVPARGRQRVWNWEV